MPCDLWGDYDTEYEDFEDEEEELTIITEAGQLTVTNIATAQLPDGRKVTDVIEQIKRETPKEYETVPLEVLLGLAERTKRES